MNKLTRTFFAGATVFTLALTLLWAQTSLQRPLNPQTGFSAGVSYVSGGDPAAATAAWVNGEVIICRDCGDDSGPEIFVWDGVNAEADKYVNISDAQTFTGAITFSAALTTTSTMTFGDDEEDEVTFDGPVNYNVLREDFDNIGFAYNVEEDFTAAVTTDGGENMFLLPTSPLGGFAYRLEAPDGPGLAGTLAPFATDGVLSLDTFTDDADNEGVVVVFGASGPDVATPHLGAYFDEDSTDSVYCEAQIDIADVSDTDDLWFGWVVSEAYDNPPASASYNTSALFTITDALGDIDIVTQLNGGGELADDAGTDWTDGDQFVLRVILSADAVEFEAALTDAGTTLTAITQTNAVLNADNSDLAHCVFGYTNAAAGDPTVTINYVEIGIEQ